MLAHLVVSLVEVGLANLDQLAQRGLVLRVDAGQSHGGQRLATDDLSQTRLALDNTVRDAHLLAQGWQVDDDLDRVHVVGDHDQLGLLLLDKRDNGVDAGAHGEWSLGWRIWLAGSSLSSSGHEAGTTVLLGLWTVLVQELEQLRGLKGQRHVSGVLVLASGAC